MSEHTPGPWVAGRPDMSTIVDGVPSKWIYAGDAYVAVASGLASPDWDVVMANARLIAAAPELLEALESCLGLIESDIYIPEPGHICGGPDSMCDSDCAFAASAYGIISRARAAITKAKGAGDE